MVVNMSGRRKPELVTMEGENLSFLGGMDYGDQLIINKGFVTARERKYLQNKYPELMGFLPILLAALPAVATAASGIISAVKGGKKESPQNVEASKTALLQMQLEQQKEQYEREQALRLQREQTTKTLLMVGVPAAALILILSMKNKRR